jgi:hypothetical protein
MNFPKFNREEWIDKLKAEIGLAHVPYEELDQHFVEFGFFAGSNSPKTNARQYIDNQLHETEESYKQFEGEEVGSVTSLITITDIDATLGDVLSNLGDIPDTVRPTNEELRQLQVPYIEMRMKQEEILCFDVSIDNKPYIVAINYDGTDVKIKDQIKHVINTTFFIEVRDKTTIRDGEQVISYYQFVNAIRPYINQTPTLTERILDDVDTNFEGGVTLEGF